MDLKSQKRIAAEVLKVGVNKVWIDPEKVDDVSKAITREDIRFHISGGVVSSKSKKGASRGRLHKREAQIKKGRQKGHGNRSGKQKARTPKKEVWMSKIRAIRDELKTMKDNSEIDESTYRKLYTRAKGNLFHSRRHLREYIERMQKET